MAKYGRFDPRNKKKGRHKTNYLQKEKKIREERKDRKYAIDETFFDSDEKGDLQPSLDVVYYTYQE